jgi:hypothetical protein
MTSSPDALKAFKNFAMSQSPPSYSPMRRRETQGSQFSESSPESDPAAGASTEDQPTNTAQENSPAPVAEEAVMDDVEDDDVSEDGHVAAAGAPADEQLAGHAQENSPAAVEEESLMDADEDADGSPAAGEAAMNEDEDASEDGDSVQAGIAASNSSAFAGLSAGVAVHQNPSASSEEEEDEALTAGAQHPAGLSEEQAIVPMPMEQDGEAHGSGGEDEDAEVSPEEKAVDNSSAKEDEMAVVRAVVPAPKKVAITRSQCDTLVPAGSPDELPSAVQYAAEDGNVLKLPRSVYDRLFAYQRQGVEWIWGLYQKNFGGILADDMGLGKTVQVAAFLACLCYSNQGSRFMVVCPPTLLEQWKRELKSWASEAGLSVHVMHGTQQERRTALRGMLAREGVMLTTYDLVRNCIDQLRSASSSSAASLLPKKRKKQTKRGCRDDDSPSEEEEAIPAPGADDSNRPWDVVIVDEGHAIKNPSCLAGRALRKLEARSRFLLTGTPLQNKLSDLWALMDFVQPGLLGNHATFERNFSEQIAKGSKRNATRFAVELKDHLARELRRLTAPHFLRRVKDEVLNDNADATGDAPAPEELPPKTDVVLWLNLTNAQVELYNLYLSTDNVRRATSGKNGMEALRAISQLKKLTNHPLLCLPKEEFSEWRMRTVPSANKQAADGASSSKPEPKGAETLGMPDGYDDDACTQPAVECQDFLARLRALLPDSAQGAALLSCKLRILSVLLPQLQKRGHRCLIFSHSTRMLDLIQACVLRVLVQLRHLLKNT